MKYIDIRVHQGGHPRCCNNIIFPSYIMKLFLLQIFLFFIGGFPPKKIKSKISRAKFLKYVFGYKQSNRQVKIYLSDLVLG